jgi:hypothetical protein
MKKPRLFIASSTEGLAVAEEIQANFHDQPEQKFDIHLWNQDIFLAGNNIIDALIDETKRCDFAIFVFSPDDIIKIKEHTFEAPRDNVVFELGLFIGSLGKECCYVVKPKNNNNFRILTDYLGVVTTNYDIDLFHNNPKGSIIALCKDIRNALTDVLHKKKEIARFGDFKSIEAHDAPLYWSTFDGETIFALNPTWKYELTREECLEAHCKRYERDNFKEANYVVNLGKDRQQYKNQEEMFLHGFCKFLKKFKRTYPAVWDIVNVKMKIYIDTFVTSNRTILIGKIDNIEHCIVFERAEGPELPALITTDERKITTMKDLILSSIEQGKSVSPNELMILGEQLNLGKFY